MVLGLVLASIVGGVIAKTIVNNRTDIRFRVRPFIDDIEAWKERAISHISRLPDNFKPFAEGVLDHIIDIVSSPHRLNHMDLKPFFSKLHDMRPIRQSETPLQYIFSKGLDEKDLGMYL